MHCTAPASSFVRQRVLCLCALQGSLPLTTGFYRCVLQRVCVYYRLTKFAGTKLCLELAELASTAVDFPKTGVWVVDLG